MDRRRIFFLLLPCWVLASCGPVRPALFVHVQDRLTGRPIPGAVCRLPDREARSDASGYCRFVLEEWKSGDTLRVTSGGYQPQEAALAGVQPAGEPPAVTMTVGLFPDRAGGLVLDAYTGRPVVGAQVSAPQRTVTTDDAGLFTIMTPTFPLSLTVGAQDYDLWRGAFFTTTVRINLRPNTLTGVIRDRYHGTPIASATVTLTGSVVLTTTTKADGRYRLEGVPERFTLQVHAPLYRPETVALERITEHDVRLRPAFLRGLVRDERDGTPVAQARVVYAGRYVHTDADGRFFLPEVPEEVVLQVLSPGFAREVVTVTESSSVTVDLTPFAVQGLYISSWVVSTYDGDPSTDDWFTTLLDFVDETELNAVVLEVKDAWGAVAYDSQTPLVRELATSDPRYDVRTIVDECHRRGIYTIAYIVTFEDSWLTAVKPEWGIQSTRGGLWEDRKGLNWGDPYRKEVWEYNVAIAKELAELGFDEVQFDYIRFPTDGDTSLIVYSEETSVEKQYDTIAAFVQYAYEQIAPTGAFISADVFGYAAWRKMFEQGQDISLMTRYLDFICPMAYPSHYSPGEQGCSNPNACPYKIVLETLIRGQAQLNEGQRARFRPWLQDFDLGEPAYGPAEIQEEIRAARDGGAIGWCLWNAGNNYTPNVDYSP